MLGTYYTVHYNAKHILYSTIHFLTHFIPEILTKLIKENKPIP